jgi:polar amino acid transport system substrate-binding protein
MFKIFFIATLLAFSAITHADQVIMGFGIFPPFAFPKGEKGIEVEIMKEALAFKGHTLKASLLPFARLAISYESKEIDATMSDIGQDDKAIQHFYGKTAVIYQNYFITLAKKNITIKTPKDLLKLSINGFPGSGKRYSDWLQKSINDGHFVESSNQNLQVLQLSNNRIDVVLSDRNIFKYYLINNKIKPILKIADFKFHQVFKENPLNYRPIFRSEKIRDDYNLGLDALKKSGRYKKIFEKYLGKK